MTANDIMNFMQMTNSDMFAQVQQMFSNKNRAEQIKVLKKLYKQRGMDLDNTAKQWGISL